MSLVDRLAVTPIGLRIRARRGDVCSGTVLTTGTRCQFTPELGDHLCTSHAARRGYVPAALTASVAAYQIDGVGWQTWRAGNRAWQTEAWRLYDITGQLRFVSNWIANCVSRCRLYVAEVDESGEAGEEANDPDIAALAAGPLGSGPAKDEALRILAVNLYIVGEGYIVAQAEGGPSGDDLWFVVSGQMIKRTGDTLSIRRSMLNGGGDMVYREGVDLVLRTWTPHPADTDEPDSPTRSAIPDLRAIEAFAKRMFAEIDSRLAGAGVLFLPDGIDFPRGDTDPDQPQLPGGIDGFEQHMTRIAATAMQDRSSAAAVVPIMATLPAEVIDKIKHLTFWSELSEHLLPLKESAVKSLAQSLDIPPEILLGTSDSNHWSSWQQSEDAITSQILPVLARIADALTSGYLRRALEEMGKDPGGYVYAFDPAPLTTRPNRAADALSYHGAGLLSDEAAVEAGAFRADQMPGKEEWLRRLAVELLQNNPELLQDPTIRGLVGIAGPIAPLDPGSAQVGPDGAPADATEIRIPDPRALPAQPAQTDDTAAVVAAVAGAVRRALTMAGNKMVPHQARDGYGVVPRWEFHARVGPVSETKANALLGGVWEDLPELARDLNLDADQLRELVHGYCVALLTRAMTHDQELLRGALTTALRGRRVPVMEMAA